jgi:hypothetical protein
VLGTDLGLRPRACNSTDTEGCTLSDVPCQHEGEALLQYWQGSAHCTLQAGTAALPVISASSKDHRLAKAADPMTITEPLIPQPE